VPPRDLVSNALDLSIEALWARDRYLLEAGTSERSLTHQLAVHLSPFFPEYSVDCEYNRDGFDVKRLALPERRGTQDDSLDAVTVFPDVIVHQRGTNRRNLLVVEVKKASSRISDEYDFQKLRAFKAELQYTFAAHLRVGFDPQGEAVTQLRFV
jgi:hypothetical protein